MPSRGRARRKPGTRPGRSRQLKPASLPHQLGLMSHLSAADSQDAVGLRLNRLKNFLGYLEIHRIPTWLGFEPNLRIGRILRQVFQPAA
jgi:hypothetical protein